MFCKLHQSTEVRIEKQGLTEKYNQEIYKGIDSEAIVLLKEEENDNYTMRALPYPLLCPQPPSGLRQTSPFQTFTLSSV